MAAPISEHPIFFVSLLSRALLVVPDLLQNLLVVIINLFQRQYAVSADIEGKFFQVAVLGHDQPPLR